MRSFVPPLSRHFTRSTFCRDLGLAVSGIAHRAASSPSPALPPLHLRGREGRLPPCMSSSAAEASTDPAASGTKRTMVKIGTHNGAFHCDEALGCFLLKQTEAFKDAEIVRTRDPEVLKDMDVVIDVGGTYDPDTKRYDHHQRGFEECFGHGFTTKLSSAGLVYKHHGMEIIANMLGLASDDPNVLKVYLATYKSLVEGLDAIDNGINQYDTDQPAKYANTTHLSARVGRLNPRWNEPSTEELAMQRFLKAVELTGAEFKESVDFCGNVWLPARVVVEKAVAGRKEVDPSGEIVVLEQACPWKDHLYTIEEEEMIEPVIKFCLYEQSGGGGWRVQAVSKTAGSFENRKSLLWKGLRDADLSEASGIEGGVFVHISGFIGGNKTFEGALAMARAALASED